MKEDEGYCAFALALIVDYPITVEEAFDAIGRGRLPRRRRLIIDADDINDMIRMRENGACYYEIAAVYGVHESSIHKRIKRYKEKRSV